MYVDTHIHIHIPISLYMHIHIHISTSKQVVHLYVYIYMYVVNPPRSTLRAFGALQVYLARLRAPHSQAEDTVNTVVVIVSSCAVD